MPSKSKAQHWNLKPLAGHRFGMLVVMKEAGRNARRSALWRCRCDCGRETVRVGSTLIAGKSSSCGCRRHSPESRAKIAATQRKDGSLMRREFRHCRDGAKHRGHAWCLTVEEFTALVTAACDYCGVEPSSERQTKYERAFFNGIDRVDNKLGYTASNCVPCCKTCNYMKRDMSRADFINAVHRVTWNQTAQLQWEARNASA